MFRFLNIYFKNYGGFAAILSSDYFWVSFFISLVEFYFSFSGNSFKSALAIFPSIVGFSIASFAVVLTIDNKTYLEIMSLDDGTGNGQILKKVSSTFSHFIVVQVLAIIISYNFSEYYNFSILILSSSDEFFELFIKALLYIFCQVVFNYPLLLIVATISSVNSIVTMLIFAIDSEKDSPPSTP